MKNGALSIGAETVQIELTDETAANTVTISMPHIWQKLLTTKSLTESRVLDANIYANEEVAFVISYTGINEQSDEDIVEAVEQNLRIYITETEYSGLEIYTAQQLNDKYGINISTATAGHVVVKFKYNTANNSKSNYIELLDNWIETNIEDVIDAQYGEELRTYATGARSSEYAVLFDDSAPIEPKIALEGTLGNNGWYKSDVVLNLIGSRTDTIKQYVLDASSGASNESVVVGGSGVAKNTLILEGAIAKAEQELTEINLVTEGISYATAKAYDYVGNVATTDRQEIKIDKTSPTAPTITLSGEEGNNGWYKSNVTINITPGTDSISGVDKTTYRIEGANQLAETTGTRYILTNEGKSTIIVTTYDKAGNETTTQMDVSIDKAIPPDASITVIKGDKNSADNLWYYTDVTLRITVDAKDAVSGLGQSSYRITGSSEVPTTQFDGTTKEITITENGTHNITVYTYTMAGNFKVTRYTVNIDKNAPNAPTVSVASGTAGENDWYTSNVNIAVVSNGDVGPSVEQRMTYTITHNGTTTIEREIKSNEKIAFNEEGEYLLKVYSSDTALNVAQAQKTIKIDKTNPKAADFVITGTKGVDDWYISDVEFEHEGAADTVSGIQSVVLSTNSITQNTAGTKVTLTTKDVAGHTVTKEVTIKLDKSIPTTPTINLLEQPTGEGVFGVMLYNKDVELTITPGEDYFLPNVDNLDRTTYEVTDKDGTNVIIPETEATSLTLTEEGRVTVIARTYDKAGNVAVSSKVIWIDKTKPETPKITNINDTNVENTSTQEIVSTSNKISLHVDNLTEGNNIKVILINQATYERIEINKTVTLGTPVEIELSEKGTYSITLTQTNMFGTESNISTGVYYYKYE